jgi:hypothetical protein
VNSANKQIKSNTKAPREFVVAVSIRMLGVMSVRIMRLEVARILAVEIERGKGLVGEGRKAEGSRMVG